MHDRSHHIRQVTAAELGEAMDNEMLLSSGSDEEQDCFGSDFSEPDSDSPSCANEGIAAAFALLAGVHVARNVDGEGVRFALSRRHSEGQFAVAL